MQQKSLFDRNGNGEGSDVPLCFLCTYHTVLAVKIGQKWLDHLVSQYPVPPQQSSRDWVIYKEWIFTSYTQRLESLWIVDYGW